MGNLPVVNLDNQIVTDKQKAWAEMGVLIYKRELQFSAIAQGIILKIKVPQTLEEIEASEALLKQLKQETKQLAELRLEITNKFRDVANRLSAPEKTLEAPLKQLTDAIIKLKEEFAKKQRLEADAINEKKNIRENVLRQLAEIKATYQNKILAQVSFAHTWALENKVAVDKVAEYIGKCADKFKVTDFADSPVMPKLLHIKEADYNAIVKEVFLLDSNSFVDQYKKDLQDKFEFYTVDFNNAEQALEKALEDKKEAEQVIATEKANSQMSATLQSMTTVTTGPVIKELKKSYEVVMTDDLQCAINVITAFVSNLENCKTKLRLTDYSKLTVAQMATALGKVKCDDNKFQPSLITFKEVSKL